jgi:hypothetical protein
MGLGRRKKKDRREANSRNILSTLPLSLKADRREAFGTASEERKWGWASQER